ncbi:26S proteasome non-ATPase regulatory subunit 9-like [Salvia splendens]|uniref:26S proteasome non-ATPase regulatory subunit 9-like n=1 Tax=Salvia splendens TaxID=180675 RepID=UPI001C2629F4|nr:26S proteasome non-ATPase regulatory subunit 9-like [Salvia splendens]
MVATNLKAETMKLMEKRSGIEEEMNVIIERLCQPGGPGLSGNLVDSEGFPRTDIDIPTVRADRHRLAELRSDHKDITEKMSQNIELLHSAKHTTATSSVKDSGPSAGMYASLGNSVAIDASSAMDADFGIGRAFAIVDEITELSPAAEDGLQLGDQILKFGNVGGGESFLQQLAAEAQQKQGEAVPLVVSRQGSLINLTVTPRTWPGRGLLGCHFRIL